MYSGTGRAGQDLAPGATVRSGGPRLPFRVGDGRLEFRLRHLRPPRDSKLPRPGLELLARPPDRRRARLLRFSNAAPERLHQVDRPVGFRSSLDTDILAGDLAVDERP